MRKITSAAVAVLMCAIAWAQTDENGITPYTWLTFDDLTPNEGGGISSSTTANSGSCANSLTLTDGSATVVNGTDMAWTFGSSSYLTGLAPANGCRPATYIVRINLNGLTYGNRCVWGVNGQMWGGIALIVNGGPGGYVIKITRHSQGGINSSICEYNVPIAQESGYHEYAMTQGDDGFMFYADGYFQICAGVTYPETQNGYLSFGQLGNNNANYTPTGLSISDFRMYDRVLTPDQIAAVAKASGVYPAISEDDPVSTPKLLVNFYNESTQQVDGWLNHTQVNGGTIPKEGTISSNDVSLTTTSGGNFFPNNSTTVNTDFAEGTYVDIYGETHTTVAEEFKASIGADVAFDENVYKTGLMNGGFTDHTATIGGLDPAKEYVVYVGFGRKKNDDANQVHGFTINSSGFTSATALEYVTTVAGNNTSAATEYQSFSAGTNIRCGTEGLLLVRAKRIAPTASGEVKFVLAGERAGINFLAVAEMPPKNPDCVAFLNGGTVDLADAGAWHDNRKPESNETAKLVVKSATSVSFGDASALPAIVTYGTGTLTLTSGTTLPSFVSSSRFIYNGGEGSTLTIGNCSSSGVLEIAEGSTVSLSQDGTRIWGVVGPGTLSWNGTGTLKLGKSGKSSTGTTINNATIEINSGTVALGYSGGSDGTVGSQQSDATFILNGGNMSAYGWIYGVANHSMIFDVRSDATVTVNDGNTTENGSIIKRGEGKLSYNSKINLPVIIEAGSMEVSAGFPSASGAVEIRNADSSFIAPLNANVYDNIITGVRGYSVVKTQINNKDVYTLKPKGFRIILQ